MTAAYENKLASDFLWALKEGGQHLRGEGGVHDTLLRIGRRLDELGIPYAIVGGMAMYYHGYRRFTEDVDIVVTSEGLRRIHEALEGLGYVPPFSGSKNLRDVKSGVRIEFIVTGEYPGDGRPKGVAFPDPAEVAVEMGGVKFVNLEKLVELKLASGTAPGRRKDLGDVQELIRVLNLPSEFAQRIDACVRPLYAELWNELQQSRSDENEYE